MPQQLAHHVAPQVGLVSVDTGDDETRTDGDQQRGNLRHQAVTDCQQCVGRQRLGHVHSQLPDTDCDPSKKVDENDDDPGDRVPLDKLHGAIEGPIQLAFAL
ncbi:hypothetical protein D3C79_969380 [compost metagenome]